MASMKAVRLERFGDVDVLELRQVERPLPGPREVLVQIRAAGINPGEAAIRKGQLENVFPTTFPSGEGSDLAGVVVETGAGVNAFKPGDEVLGFSHTRGSHAEFAAVPFDQLTRKPSGVSFDVAGALFVAGTTAWAAVRAIDLAAGETVVVTGAAGGVGSLAAQLARRAGANVLGVAGPGNDQWLRAHGITPVNYGDGLARRLTEARRTGASTRCWISSGRPMSRSPSTNSGFRPPG